MLCCLSVCSIDILSAINCQLMFTNLCLSTHACQLMFVNACMSTYVCHSLIVECRLSSVSSSVICRVPLSSVKKPPFFRAMVSTIKMGPRGGKWRHTITSTAEKWSALNALAHFLDLFHTQEATKNGGDKPRPLGRTKCA